MANAVIFAPGLLIVFHSGTLLEIGNSGSDYYLHKDWLGNARISTSVAGHALVADNAFSPYGETYNVLDSTNQNQQMFTGLTQDVLSGMWDTPNRELTPQGRWLSPDPAGQGWNQYAYSTNPNGNVDPTGLSATMAMMNGSGWDWSTIEFDSAGSTNDFGPQAFGTVEADGIAQLMGNINAVVAAVFQPELQVMNSALSHWDDYYQQFVDSGMSPTAVTVGWFNNDSFLNPYGHIAMGVGSSPMMGFNPASDTGFLESVMAWTVACMDGSCNPLAQAVVPGVVSPQSSSGNSLAQISFSISANQGIAIQTAIMLSAENPPNYSVGSSCDCASWAQQMLGFGGINSGSPQWEPSTLMIQLADQRGNQP